MNTQKMQNNPECVKVIIRCRPMSEKEVSEGHNQIIEMHTDRGIVEIRNPKERNESKQYNFDSVYDWNATQTDLYDEIFRPLVSSVLEGFNGTIFAYGQTGTGKTHTMEGIIPNSFEQIFNCIGRTQHQQYLVRSSYLEIYQEEVRDLLAKDQSKRLELKERPDIGVYVKDLSSFVCKSIKEIEHVMSVGNQNRSVGSTNMNEHSSRSHAIFIITIEHSVIGIDGDNHIRVGKLNLVDLAGSERQNKTGAVGQRQKEGIKINLSLSALGNVISSLVDGKSTHIPYRDSKLTRLLQDSLGGNSKTVMVANIGPASYNYEETMTTLRYADRAKNIKNKPRVNEDPKDALLMEFQTEIERLKQQLNERKNKKDNIKVNGNNTPDAVTVIDREATEKLELKIKAMESKLLCGEKDIIDHTNDQTIQLEIKRQELAQQKQKEIEIKQKLEEHEETTIDVRETFTSLQQEVEIKRKKLRKLIAKLHSFKIEIRDVQETNAREMREFEDMQNDLIKDCKLRYLIMDNFIPIDEKNKLLIRTSFDDDDDNWKVLKLSHDNEIIKRPSSCKGNRFPISDYAEMAATVGSFARYKIENIHDLKLDMPIRSTRDYNAPSLSPRVRAALDKALKGEDDVDIDVDSIHSRNDFFSAKSRKRLSVDDRRNGSASSLIKMDTDVRKVKQKLIRSDTVTVNQQNYPKARGLIRK